MTAFEFIVAMKWPFTVLIVLLVVIIALWRSPELRQSLTTKDFRVEAAGVVLEARTQELEQNLEAASVSAAPAELGQQPIGQITGSSSEVEARSDHSEAPHREAMEHLVQSAAEWGFSAAKGGRETLPELTVDWSGDRPKLDYPGRDLYTLLAGSASVLVEAAFTDLWKRTSPAVARALQQQDEGRGGQ
ncbi:hypothetical protein [Streptomyces nigrescens]